MEIVKYKKEYEKDFIELNTAWIEKYFAIEDDRVLATCMAAPFGDNVWEICKLAADERYQGNGAGSAVFKACMDYAIEQGAEKLTLISNHILKPALHIYEKFGFQSVPLGREDEYVRGDVQYEYIVPAAGQR